MGVKNNEFAGGDGNTMKSVERAGGNYKPSVAATETDTAERLPTKQLPEGPAPSPFKIKGGLD